MSEVKAIYSPRNLNEVLSLLASNPMAKIIAGGTLSTRITAPNPYLTADQVIISLHQTEDLRKVTYGDRFIDLGSAIPLNHILHVGKNFLNPALRIAVKSIGTFSLRNLATLGGNLCQKTFLGDLFPVFHLLGAQFELRSPRSGRWLTAHQIVEEGGIILAPGEILTRVRIPQEDWPINFYHKIGNYRTPWDERLSMVCLANTKGGTLDSIRFIFYLPHTGILRHRGIEAELSGQTLPMELKQRRQAMEKISEAIERLALPPSQFQRDRIAHMVRWVMSQLQDD